MTAAAPNPMAVLSSYIDGLIADDDERLEPLVQVGWIQDGLITKKGAQIYGRYITSTREAQT